MMLRYPQERYQVDERPTGLTSPIKLKSAPSTHIVGPMLILHKKQNGTNMERVAHALSLPFNPKLTRALMNLDSFKDLPIDKVKRYVKGLIINIDNTLAEPGTQEFPPEVMAKIDEIQRAFRVCFYTNDDDYRPALEKTGIHFARNIPAKPDPDGFKMAARLRLDLSPEECAMVGSDYTLDGASRKAGMKYIHVEPISGPKEPFTEKFVRGYGNLIARIHDKFRKK